MVLGTEPGSVLGVLAGLGAVMERGTATNACQWGQSEFKRFEYLME